MTPTDALFEQVEEHLNDYMCASPVLQKECSMCQDALRALAALRELRDRVGRLEAAIQQAIGHDNLYRSGPHRATQEILRAALAAAEEPER